MNIRYLKEKLTKIEEITVIGRNVVIEGVICNVMGFVRYGAQIQLLILQYDEEFIENEGEHETTDLYPASKIPESNRLGMRELRLNHPRNPFQSVSKLFLGDREYDIHSFENSRLYQQDWEKVLLLTEFLRQGWIPEGIDFQDINMLYLSSLELKGTYTKIPDLGEKPILRFVKGPCSRNYLVEQPVILNINGNYHEKLWFKDAVTKDTHWVQINQVYLSDLLAEMEAGLNKPEIQEHMTQEQITQMKANIEKQYAKVCPKGRCLPIVEYECEEDIFLQFYSKAFLEAAPPVTNGCSSMGFIIGPEQETGILGLKLKAAVIQEPVLPDTASIEAELFEYSCILTGDIIL